MTARGVVCAVEDWIDGVRLEMNLQADARLKAARYDINNMGNVELTSDINSTTTDMGIATSSQHYHQP